MCMLWNSLNSQTRYNEQNHLNNVFAKMITLVFLLLLPNLLFICFSYQGNGTEICMHACFEIVWTHKPCAISKNTILHVFFAKIMRTVFCWLYRISCLYVFISKSETNKRNFRHVYILVMQIGLGTSFIVKTSFKGNLVIVWQLAVSEKSEKLR